MADTKVPIQTKYGRLTVIGEPFKKFTGKYIRTVCECGNEKEVKISHLKDGRTKSCGCIANETRATRCVTHGMTDKHPLYGTWNNIKGRCFNNRDAAYKNYGGRGIKICDEWRNDFKLFFDWCMANGWQKGLMIDRQDNNGNYEPSNCRFVTPKENCRNKRNTLGYEKVNHIRSLYATGNYSQKQLADLYGVAHTTINAITRGKNWV